MQTGSEKTMKCTCCGTEIKNIPEFHMRRDWQRRSWTFCEKCIKTGKAIEWGEKEEDERRKMK